MDEWADDITLSQRRKVLTDIFWPDPDPIEPLAPNTVVRHPISRINIEDETAEATALAIAANTTLTSLRIDEEVMTEMTLLILCRGVMNSVAPIRALAFQGVNIVLAINSITQIFSSSSTLTELSFHSTPLGPAGARVIADALSSNQILTKLDLYGCSLGPLGVKALTPVLNRCPLVSLFLIRNQLNEMGLVDLGNALRYVSTLTKLSIMNEEMTPLAIKAFSSFLSPSLNLTELRLRDMQLGDDGACMIAEGLKFNSTLNNSSTLLAITLVIAVDTLWQKCYLSWSLRLLVCIRMISLILEQDFLPAFLVPILLCDTWS